jgi:hypothetical protein
MTSKVFSVTTLDSFSCSNKVYCKIKILIWLNELTIVLWQINIEGINNTDVWLYQLDNLGNVAGFWEQVQSVYAAAVEQLAPGTRDIYSVSSRTNDQITLNFGDGIFATIPVGTFRTYVRASNGLTYIINPVEMQSVSVPISYVSRTGQIETITFTCGITQPVTNAQARETIARNQTACSGTVLHTESEWSMEKITPVSFYTIHQHTQKLSCKSCFNWYQSLS